jgi:hypothetical protein
VRPGLIDSSADAVRAFLVLLSFLFTESSWEAEMERTYLAVLGSKSPTAENVEVKELNLLPDPKKLSVTPSMSAAGSSTSAWFRGGEEALHFDKKTKKKRYRLRLRWSNDSSREATQRRWSFG